MTIDELCVLLKAEEAGKQIQIYAGEWQNVGSLKGYILSTLLYSREFRIKPEPREIWINMYDDNEFGLIYHSLEAAQEKAAKHKGVTVTQVKFREVLDEDQK